MKDYFLEAAAGNAPSNTEVIHKYGRNLATGTTFSPVCVGGIYRTPQVAAATTLRVKAGNANDTAAGSGAREVSIIGTDASGAIATEKLVTAGETASANTVNSYIRLIDIEVTKSGTYATTATGSHTANVVIENSAGTEDWATIDSVNYPKGKSEIGCYTVPAGRQAYITSLHYQTDTNKTSDILVLFRDGILETAAPYSEMRIIHAVYGVSRTGEENFQIPLGPFGPATDIIMVARVSATTSVVAASFELLLRERE